MTTIALVYASTTREPGALATASIAAWLKSRSPELEVHLFRLKPTTLPTLELELFRLSPSLIALWCPVEGGTDFTHLLARARAALPRTKLALIGPALATRADAAGLLSRHPEAHLAIRGEPEAPLLELCRQDGGTSRLPATPLAGASWRAPAQRGDTDDPDVTPLGRILHGPDRVGTLAPLELASPFASAPDDHDHVTGGVAWLEIQRGPLPFSPLPLPLQPGPVRPVPLERLRQDIPTLLETRPAVLHLVSSPADTQPAHLFQALKILAEHEHDAVVALELGALPGDELATRLWEAGVARLTLEHPAGGPGDEGGGDPIERVGLKQLVARGFDVTVRLPIGRPGEGVETLRRMVDHYLSVPIAKLELAPLRLWPGHPLAETGGLTAAGAPGFEVLRSDALRCEELAGLERWGHLLEALLPTFGATFRLLARALELTPAALLEQLAAWEDAHRSEGLRAPIPSRRRQALVSFAREKLMAERRADRIPVIATMADFDLWVRTTHRPQRPAREIEYETGELRDLVLELTPGTELRSFPFDVLRLRHGQGFDDAPVHRTHLLLRRQGLRPALVAQATDLQRRLLEVVDGVRPVRECINAIASSMPPRQEALDLESAYLNLLSQKLLYVKQRADEPPPPPPSSKGKVLAFRRLRSASR